MSTIATLAVLLTLNSQAFKEGLAAAKGEAETASTGIVGGLASVGKVAVIAGAAGVAAAIAGVVEISKTGVEQAGKWAESMHVVGEKLGTTTTQSAGLLLISQRMGIDQDTLTGSILKFAKGLETVNGQAGTSAKGLADLGLSAYDSNGKMLDTTTILSNVSDKLNAMPDGLEKDRLEMELFGKSGTNINDLMTGLANGGLQTAEDKAKSLGLTSDDTKNAAIELGRNWNELKSVSDAAFTQIGNKIIPILSQILDKFLVWVESPEIQAGIQNIATWFGNLAQGIADKLPGILAFLQKLPAWFETYKPIIVGVLAALGVAMLIFAYTAAASFLTMEIAGAPIILILLAIVAVVAAVYYAITHWSEISAFIKKIWDDVLKFLEGIWKSIVDWCTKVATAIYTFLKPIIDPVIRIFNDVIDFFKNIFTGNFKGAWNDIVDIFKTYIDTFLTVGNSIGENIWTGITSWFTKIWNDVVNFISGIVSKIKDAIAGAKDSASTATGSTGYAPRAGGGSVFGGQTYVVGENGPEIFTSNINGKIIPNSQISGGNGGSQAQSPVQKRRNITDEDAQAIGSAIYHAMQQAGAF